jgi:polyferredoxin
LALLAFVLLAMPPASRAGLDVRYPQARSFFPEADRFGDLEGEPPAAPVYRSGQLLGYVFLSNDVLRIPAYSGKPINTLVGFDLSGRITGLAIVEHEEPILAVGVSEERLRRYVDQYRGLNVFDRVVVGYPRPGAVNVDTISGATITVMVVNAVVMKSARAVAESRGLAPPPPGAEASAPLDRAAAKPATSPPAPAAPAPRAAGAKKPPAQLGAPPPSGRPTRAASSSLSPAVPEEPLWVGVWRERRFQIAVLGLGLGVLTLILVFQDWVARRPRFLKFLRRGFLLYTVFFIGWYALAQLSVVNVFTFLHALFHGFRWENFLIEPMVFILWSFVAFTLLLWGRGVYCGWLCPFGAMQELIQLLARRLRVPQLEIPHLVHERLWALKYVILIALFGISLQSLGQAVVYAEIEPFKTAVTLRFQRDWPFVLYAVALLALSAFNRKFFCKYLCPLGAALSIPGRFRVFDWWLRRRKECGKPCQVCAVECEVHAIRPTGEINHNECHYCLDCQVTFYNAYKCPPLAERRKRLERRPAPPPSDSAAVVLSTAAAAAPIAGDRPAGGCDACPARAIDS